ncbi:M28 family peptidase [Ornithinimicrobium flavum]|uniref:M28 family peptidase n=1 Tax=Ornithinimicrobium flavum TaxID=1288636 RepID=UPI001070638E|nr:M28 family peptidase [Ornithinimicrobium flavum]
MRNPRAVAVSAATAFVVAGLASPALAGPGKGPGNNNGNPNNPTKMARAIQVDNVMAHLEAFQEIADANGGNRAVGTPGYQASAEYVEQVLEAAGYTPERQYFTIDLSRTEFQLLRENSPEQREITHRAMSYSPSTPEGGVTADLAAPSVDAQGCDADAWGGTDLTDKIALVSRGTCAFGVKSLVAGSLGAEGVIVYNNTAGILNGTLGGLDDDHVPATGITQAEGQVLLGKMANGAVNVTLDIQAFAGEVETFNIIAETSKGRTDNVVMAGAHLDGAFEGAGINDNGSGSGSILEAAVQLARVNTLNNQVRFVWWGAEENGLLGSNHYVADLAANDPDELDNIATYLNFDMVASPNYIIGVYDADESTYDASVPPPAGSIATEKVLTDWFDATGQPWVDTAYSGRSDYQAFILNGIPASGLFTGADGTKTAAEAELFGGTAGITYDPNYHTALDDIDNVDETALEIMSKAIGAAVISLAQDTSAINGERSAGKSGKPHPGGPVPVEEEAPDAA